MNGKVICRPVTAEDRTPLLRAAVADGHKPMLPTHVWERDGKIVACASIGVMTILGGWAHSTEMSDTEALAALALAEEHARQIGAKYVVMPCTDDCRYKPHLENQGYMMGNATVKLNIKRL